MYLFLFNNNKVFLSLLLLHAHAAFVDRHVFYLHLTKHWLRRFISYLALFLRIIFFFMFSFFLPFFISLFDLKTFVHVSHSSVDTFPAQNNHSCADRVKRYSNPSVILLTPHFFIVQNRQNKWCGKEPYACTQATNSKILITNEIHLWYNFLFWLPLPTSII